MSKRRLSKRMREFLAAPETVEHDQRERKKAIERRLEAEARKARNRAAKSKETPSREDMLADVVRVANDATDNRWSAYQTISRPRYVIFGHYPVEFLDRMFGTFAHALEQAGLRDEIGTRIWRRERANASREEHAQRYVDRYLAPYTVGAEHRRALSSSYLLLSISDTHAHFLDPFVWYGFLSAIRDLKPNGVLLNGDILDGGEISKHPKIRKRSLRLKDELAFQRTMFRQLRQVHGGDLFSVCGNHDLADRLPRYLSSIDPVISDIDDRRVDEIMGLGEFDVKLFHGGSTKSPAGTEDASPGFLFGGFYRIHHGTKLGQTPSLAELRAIGRSGQSGHVHRASLTFGTTERDEGYSWMTTPMGATHQVGLYVPGPVTGWQRGFGVAWLYPDQTVHQYPVIVTRGESGAERMTVEGHVYTRPATIINPDPFDGRNWLEQTA